MVRKKKKKIDVNREPDQRVENSYFNCNYSSDFWLKVKNGFKKFLESPFK